MDKKEWFWQIIENATEGSGTCQDCPAYIKGNSCLVSPGAGDLNADIIFLTEEPRHSVNWDRFNDLEEYIDWFMNWFREKRGGKYISKILDIEDTNIDISDVWIADSIKCPTEKYNKTGAGNVSSKEAFESCRSYLKNEIELIDPEVIVPLGSRAVERAHITMGISKTEIKDLSITRSYGLSRYNTKYPIVNCLHWAQRSLPQAEFIPKIRHDIRTTLNV